MSKEADIYCYEQVDADGEITRKVSLKRRKANMNFVMLFLDDELDIVRDNKMIIGVLCEFIKCMCYVNPDAYGQTIGLTPSMKKRIADNCKIQVNTLTKIMAQMLELNIMKRVERSTYMINPHLVGKGSLTDIIRAQEVYDGLQ